MSNLTNSDLKDHLREFLPTSTQARIDQIVRHYVALVADLANSADAYSDRGHGKFRYVPETDSRYPWIGFRPSKSISNKPEDLVSESPFREKLLAYVKKVTGSNAGDMHNDAVFVALAAYDLAFISGKKVTVIKGGTFSVDVRRPMLVKTKKKGKPCYFFRHAYSIKSKA